MSAHRHEVDIGVALMNIMDVSPEDNDQINQRLTNLETSFNAAMETGIMYVYNSKEEFFSSCSGYFIQMV